MPEIHLWCTAKRIKKTFDKKNLSIIPTRGRAHTKRKKNHICLYYMYIYLYQRMNHFHPSKNFCSLQFCRRFLLGKGTRVDVMVLEFPGVQMHRLTHATCNQKQFHTNTAHIFLLFYI